MQHFIMPVKGCCALCQNKINGSAQADNGRHVECAGFQTVGHFLRLRQQLGLAACAALGNGF